MAAARARLALLALMGLLLAPAAPAQPRQVEDAAYGETLFHYYLDDHFTALTHLMAARERSRTPRDAAEAELLLGSLQLSYGLTDAAEAIFQRLLKDDVPQSVRDRAWYYLARLAFQRGRLDQATAALARMGGALPPELRGRQQLLSGLVLMQQGDYANAAKALEPFHGLPEDLPYARYNLGIALIRAGQLEAGVAVLEEQGRLKTSDPALQSLRDKTNMALGQALLERAPDAAQRSLERVRLHGPMSNMALLGAGWAKITAGDYQGALLPWRELASRPVSDPAVQEALLALPYALMELKARDQAAEAYATAIVQLDAEAARLEAAMGAVERGELLQTLLAIDPRGNELPEVTALPGREYLGQLMASHRFRRALKDYQDLRALQDNLRFWQARLPDYRDIVSASRERLQAALPTVDQRASRLDPAEAPNALRESAGAPERAGGPAVLPTQHAALGAATRQAHERLQRLDQRLALTRTQLESTLPRLDQALERQRRLLDLRALQTLGARRDTLRAQVAQARFAAAQLFDPAAERAERTPE